MPGLDLSCVANIPATIACLSNACLATSIANLDHFHRKYARHIDASSSVAEDAVEQWYASLCISRCRPGSSLVVVGYDKSREDGLRDLEGIQTQMCRMRKVGLS